MNIDQIKRNKKNILVALALIGTGIYLTIRTRAVQPQMRPCRWRLRW